MEILSPAGNPEALRVAIYNGADAVYLGLSEFNARAKADNFTKENLASSVHFAHLFGVKVYCTFNTLIKNNELQEALHLIKFADECKVDAIILQDLGLLSIVATTMPHITLHASTQMGIHNLEGALAAEKLGFKRIILSRETSLTDIKKIHEGTGLEIEYFVHGALCVAFSGNCYFSSLVSGYSGNRGKCMQLCRKKYTLLNASQSDNVSCENGINKNAYGNKAENNRLLKNGYYLSSKDLCFVNELKELSEAGVVSLKIEGRMRGSEYVGETARVYKQAVNALEMAKDEINKDISADNIKSKKYLNEKDNLNDLKAVFNRGDFCTSHLYENSQGNIIYSKAQNNIGLSVGTVVAVQNGTAKLSLNRKLNVGDGVKYMRDSYEVGAGLISSCDSLTTFKGNIKVGDEVRLTSDSSLAAKVSKQEKFLFINAQATFLEGSPPELNLKYSLLDNDEKNKLNTTEIIEICCKGEGEVAKAVNQPLSKESVVAALSKIGGTHFKLKDFTLNMQGDLFYPVSALNSLRRDAVKLIEEKILIHNALCHDMCDITNNVKMEFSYKWLKLQEKSLVFLQIDNANKIDEILIEYCDYVIYNPKEFVLNEVINFKNIYGDKAILNMPLIARGADIDILKEIVENSGVEIFIANNLYALELCENKTLIAGSGLNLLNDALSVTKVNSIEGNKYEYDVNSILYAYGYQTFMTLCHCPKKEYSSCGKCDSNDMSIIDEGGNKFVLRRNKIHNCYWQLINSTPFNILSETKRMKNANLLIDLTLVNNFDSKKVLEYVFFDKSFDLKHTHGNYGKKLF